MAISIVALVLLLALALMCIDSFRMAKESGEGIEAGIILSACFLTIGYIILTSVF